MKKQIICIFLALVMVLSLAACGAGSNKQNMPKLRINTETNEWEVSYDGGTLWETMGVKATGEAGADGKDGVDGVNGTNGKDGVNGKDGIDGKDGADGVNGTNGKDGADGVNGTNGKDGKDGIDGNGGADGANGTNGKDGKDGVDGKDGKDGVDGKDGKDGVDGKDGITPHIGEDGFWYIGDTCTWVYAGEQVKFTVTFMEFSRENKVVVSAGDKAESYTPTSAVATFDGWYTDESCTTAYDFSSEVTKNITLYSKWTYDETFAKVGSLMKNVSFGYASCIGTTNCFNSVYYRVLADDHGYYNGAAEIENYLKGVFVEDAQGNVSVSTSCSLANASYRCPSLIVLNFASAFSSYQEYILRNNMEMPSDLAKQKELAIKYFQTVDYTADSYHTHQTGNFGMQFNSMGVSVVMLGALMEQQETDRFETLIKNAYDNVDSGFWGSSTYLNPFYQLCAKYDWFDSTKLPAVGETLSDSDVLNLYAYGIDVAGDYSEKWNAWQTDALSDDVLDAAEAKAFAYHYAYQLTDGNCWLGVYGSSRAIVDFSDVIE